MLCCHGEAFWLNQDAGIPDWLSRLLSWVVRYVIVVVVNNVSFNSEEAVLVEKLNYLKTKESPVITFGHDSFNHIYFIYLKTYSRLSQLPLRCVYTSLYLYPRNG